MRCIDKVKAVCTYDNVWELGLAQWLNDHLDEVDRMHNEDLSLYKRRLNARVQKLLEKADVDESILSEEALQPVMGELYYNTMILLIIMKKGKSRYATYQKWNPHLDAWLAKMDRIIELENMYSSTNRGKDISKLLKSIVL